MKWRIFFIIFFFMGNSFAMGEDVSSSTMTVTTENTTSDNYIPDPCLDIQDPNAKQECQQMWQEQRNNIGQGTNKTDITSTHREITGPSLSPLPAWEQALEPQSTTVTNAENETIVPSMPNTNTPVNLVPITSTPVVKPAPVLPEGKIMTDKERTTTLHNGNTEVIDKETTTTNRDGNIENTTTTTQEIYHLDAPQ